VPVSKIPLIDLEIDLAQLETRGSEDLLEKEGGLMTRDKGRKCVSGGIRYVK